ncbi:uncharacterized protein EV420DRAFT_1483549 [Desarmillaria tabescens]|uniref:Uncharacterized protein n=1 Tax=Armillaria tabescens TaxID=1929756 RepID=A0AA39MVL9_ARMTA|nr:uncharacterized protein EV420DRAFT_1483549 [Desarmillaria tabescens]KAK0448307.1 hypothetical protein EV420DRAFT_1483549 [Desarmillaria tabescens]
MGLFSFFQGSNENAGKKTEEKDALQTLKSFIETRPSSQYTFDSERDSPRSTICRPSDSPDGKECITIEMNSKKLFTTMQASELVGMMYNTGTGRLSQADAVG